MLLIAGKCIILAQIARLCFYLVNPHTHTLTLSLCKPIRFQRLYDVCTGSTQDLLDKCRAEPSQVRPTQSRGGRAVLCQTVDQYQLFSRETALGERKVKHFSTNW